MILKLSVLDDGGNELCFAHQPLELPADPSTIMDGIVRQAVTGPALATLREMVERRNKKTAENVSGKMDGRGQA